jgi:putative NIF3 family GTP cyclohydrolase 1 type 2
MVVYRSHSNWDALAGDGVLDQAVAALGIAGLEVVAAQRFFKVHRLPRPMRVRDLKARAEVGLGFGGCRLFGDGERVVERFAFLIGGFGENQRQMPQAAVEMGAEALIIGEMSEFIVVAALELGVPVVETLHSVSEIPAIRRQAEVLAARLPALPVRYVASGALAFGEG